jgi:hypothetical protein
MRAQFASVMLLCAACGGSSGDSPDGGIPDVGSPPDALTCSIAPAPQPTADTFARAISFDVSVATADTPLAVAADGDDYLVFARFAVHRVSGDGQQVTTTPYTVPGASYVSVGGVVAGQDAFGAMVGVSGGPSAGFYFCILDAAGGLDITRCTSISSLTHMGFDGTSYWLYRVVDGRLERWSYDTSPTLTGVVDLSMAGWTTLNVLAASMSTTQEHLFVLDHESGATCTRIRQHSISAGGHVAGDLVPSDAIATDASRIADDGVTAAAVVQGSCMSPVCQGATFGDTALLTTFDGPATVVPRSNSIAGAVLRDGGRTVLIDTEVHCGEEPSRTWCLSSALLSRYRDDGTVDVYEAAVVGERISEWLWMAAMVEAPNVYVLAYATDSELRLVRVQVP